MDELLAIIAQQDVWLQGNATLVASLQEEVAVCDSTLAGCESSLAEETQIANTCLSALNNCTNGTAANLVMQLAQCNMTLNATQTNLTNCENTGAILQANLTFCEQNLASNATADQLCLGNLSLALQNNTILAFNLSFCQQELQNNATADALCNLYLTSCNANLTQQLTNINNLNGFLTRCRAQLEGNSTYEPLWIECEELLGTCQTNATNCAESLTACDSSLALAQLNASSCTTNLASAQANASSCATNLATCSASLLSAQGNASSCATNQTNLNILASQLLEEPLMQQMTTVPVFLGSVARLNNANYAGALVRLYNGSMYQDFKPTPNEGILNVSAVLAFANGGTASVATLYDQVRSALGCDPLTP